MQDYLKRNLSVSDASFIFIGKQFDAVMVTFYSKYGADSKMIEPQMKDMVRN